jgi:hypothetical protein
MTRTTLAILLGAAAALAGCNKQDHTIGAGPDEGNNVAVNTAPIELPPAIIASKIYRCKDNSVVYIDWLSDNKSANVRSEQNGAPTNLVAPEAGKPMVAEGYSLTGSATGSSITLTRPGKGSASCHV